MLGGIACWLIQRNRSLLVGESVPPHIRTQLLKILNENPAVEEVVDLRTRLRVVDTCAVKILPPVLLATRPSLMIVDKPQQQVAALF